MEKQILVSESYTRFESKYERGNHIVGVSMWEFEWCPKYRYKMFAKFKYKNLAEACIRQVCHKHDIEIIVIKVMPKLSLDC